MLNCIVVQRERLTTAAEMLEGAIAVDETAIENVGLAVEIIEAANATATETPFNVIFDTLVDDPASVNEIVDAYLGEIMVEAASAVDAINLVSVYDVNVAETMTAIDTIDGSVTISAAIWDAATVTAVTLSGGNLVATNTGTTSADQGAHVAAASGKTTGKYYFEVTWTASTGGGNRSVGVGTTASTYTNMGNGGTTGLVFYPGGGVVWSNGSQIAAPGVASVGQTIGIAVDLDNRRFWYRTTPSGNWNAGGTANPATNVGGYTVPAGTMVPFVTFGGGGGAANNVFTANFGATTFAGAVPSGFTSGWPP